MGKPSEIRPATRLQAIKMLKKYFLEHLVDDPFDGTRFDCDVLDSLEKLEEKYKDE